MGSPGIVTVVDADILSVEEPPEKKVRLNNSLREQLDQVVPGLGTDLQLYFKSIIKSEDSDKAQEKNRRALMTFMNRPAAIAGLKVKSLSTDTTLGSAGAIMQAEDALKKKEGYPHNNVLTWIVYLSKPAYQCDSTFVPAESLKKLNRVVSTHPKGTDLFCGAIQMSLH